MSTSFRTVMSDWLQSQGLVLPSGPPQPVYTLTFAEMTLHCCHLQPAWVDLLVEAGALVNRQAADVLTGLLALNRIFPADAPVTVSLDAPTGQITVWCRHTLEGLDVSSLQRLAQLLQARTHDVRQCLAGTAHVCTATPASVSGSRPSSLQEMLQRRQ